MKGQRAHSTPIVSMEIDKLAIITRKLDDVAGEVELLDVRFVIGNVTYEWDDGGLYVCGDE